MSNETELKKLQPKERAVFEKFIDGVKLLGYGVVITDGLRTYNEQVALHAKNPKNAKPGTSRHESGRALDINLTKNGVIVLRKADSKADWEKTGVPQLAKSMGLKWGGDYKNYHDPVHFEIPSGYVEQVKEAAEKVYNEVKKNPMLILLLIVSVFVFVLLQN